MQTEFVDMRNTMDGMNFMLETTEGIISKPKSIAIETFLIETQRKKMSRG